METYVVVSILESKVARSDCTQAGRQGRKPHNVVCRVSLLSDHSRIPRSIRLMLRGTTTNPSRHDDCIYWITSYNLTAHRKDAQQVYQRLSALEYPSSHESMYAMKSWNIWRTQWRPEKAERTKTALHCDATDTFFLTREAPRSAPSLQI